MVAVFPIYFADVACAGDPKEVATGRLAAINSLGLAIVALLAPILGTVADRTARKKLFLGTFLMLGVTAVTWLASIGYGDWYRALILYGLCLIGLNGSFVFYDALLPHIAKPEEVHGA